MWDSKNLLRNMKDYIKNKRICFSSGWKWKSESVSGSVVSDSLWSHEPHPTRLLHPWNSPGKNTGVGCHFLLQDIFPTQGSTLGLPHCSQALYPLSHQGSPLSSVWEYQFFVNYFMIQQNSKKTLNEFSR